MFDFFKLKAKPIKRPFQLNELIEILQDGVCITRENGVIIYMNKAAYFFLQLPQNTNVVQYNWFEDFIFENSHSTILKNQLTEQGIIRNFEIQLKTAENELLDVILTANILGDYRQETFGYLFLFKDITELKKIQQQLLQTQKLESIGLMASGIAHDFNNILAAIIPNAELIKISTEEKNPNYKRAEIIERSAHRASEIAQRLLTFTRQSDHRNYEPIYLNKVIEDSLDLLEHSIADKIEIVKNFESDLRLINADEAQVQQIIMNLLLNAADAMPNGGKIEINTENFKISEFYQIGSLDPGEYVRLVIKDNGSGIPLEIMSKIFDPFFTTKDIGKGTGLGLSVVYGIVKGLNGHIEVFSKIEEGTHFDIYLPVDQRFIEIEKPHEAHASEPKNIKLIIIDDEDYVLNILSDTLEYLGYEVIKFNNGKEAISYFKKQENNINYAIIDLKMPKMDGRMVSAELRKVKPDLKIIFTSGFDDHPVTEENLAGVVGFLKKPYSIRQVSRSLEEIIK
ncbi:MAG: response regulator [bacterium]|nr:MAG: response regulator [bacterium]